MKTRIEVDTLERAADTLAENARLRAVNAELVAALRIAVHHLWDSLGGDDDKYNAERANNILKPIRAALARAEGGK